MGHSLTVKLDWLCWSGFYVSWILLQIVIYLSLLNLAVQNVFLIYGQSTLYAIWRPFYLSTIILFSLMENSVLNRNKRGLNCQTYSNFYLWEANSSFIMSLKKNSYSYFQLWALICWIPLSLFNRQTFPGNRTSGRYMSRCRLGIDLVFLHRL